MKRVLVLEGRYFPKASANTICMQNVLDSLEKNLYEVDIICYKDGLENENKNVYKISRGLIQSLLYNIENKTSQWCLLLRKILQLLIMGKQFLLSPLFPLSDPIFTLRELLLAEKLHKRNNYDIIIAVHMPLSSLIVGSIMKYKHRTLHYYPYFLDSLIGGNYPRFISRNKYEKQAMRWEKHLTKNADKIIYMKSAKEHHQNVFDAELMNRKIVYLDIPLLKNIKKSFDKNSGEEILFVYLGSIPLTVRSPKYFLEIFIRCKYPNWRLIFVGSDRCNLLYEYKKIDYRIEILSSLPHDDALEYVRKADVLLNFGNNNPNLTPSKIFEYMSYGKKIISTYPIQADTSIKYLKKYKNSLLLDESKPITDAVLQEVKMFATDSEVEIDETELMQEFYDNTPQAFIDAIT